MRRRREQQLAEGCIKEARETLGPGWYHVSDDVRWGLVSARILGILRAQNALDGTTEQQAHILVFVSEIDRWAMAQRLNDWKPIR